MKIGLYTLTLCALSVGIMHAMTDINEQDIHIGRIVNNSDEPAFLRIKEDGEDKLWLIIDEHTEVADVKVPNKDAYLVAKAKLGMQRDVTPLTRNLEAIRINLSERGFLSVNMR